MLTSIGRGASALSTRRAAVRRRSLSAVAIGPDSHGFGGLDLVVRNRCRELIVSVSVLDDLVVPFLDPLNHVFTRAALQLTLDAKPLDDYLLSIDSTNPRSSESKVFGILVVEKASGIFPNLLANSGETFSVAEVPAVHCSSPSGYDQLNGCGSRLSTS
ncbi:hypothetical protein C2R22_02390 [Salinigranum rubrum]|uniref:Uncharacterized protein n=1 Tax=Salinigranum rubrum TaxID=755307 RepID=A0A2I8VFD4_9EURY|nr:hypothetical protein C2R22_02390 [Salinigranum rubrum]